MNDANHSVGETFRLQFVWRLPSDDYLRAIFNAEVLMLDELSNKYVVSLSEFVAGRQENNQGEMRSSDEVAHDYWALVAQLVGKTIAIAYESDDGRPLWLRLETLTGEHNFFRRLNEVPEYFRDKLPDLELKDTSDE
jgi:hypothetical protein